MSFAGDYKLKRLDICYPSQPNTPIMDIKSMVSEVLVYESIETPFIKTDVIINDLESFHDLLKGQEILHFNIESNIKGVGTSTLNLSLMLHRISDRIKFERQETYRLEFINSDTFVNELDSKRVNKVYKNVKFSNIVTDILTKELKTNEKRKIESTDRNVRYVVPNWRPFDAISWTCAKATRSSKSNQTGYLFFFNDRDGYVYTSVDKLLEDPVKKPQLQTFVYRQKNLGTENSQVQNSQLEDFTAIQSIKYNDVTRDLEQLRLGSYGGTAVGIDLVDLRPSTKKLYTIDEYFNRMSHAEKVKPFGKSGIPIHKTHSRQWLIGLPTYLYSNTGAGGSSNFDGNVVDKSLDEFLYSNLRYVSMKHFVISITIPGNTTVTAGDCVYIKVPAKDRSKSNKLIEDPIYSGKYLVTSLVHRWTPEKLETILYLARDTQWKEPKVV
jgi:hypothetical protein